MDQHVRQLFVSLGNVDPEMVQEVEQSYAKLSKMWSERGRQGPFIVPILVATIKRYVKLEYPSESLPMITALAWGAAMQLLEKGRKDEDQSK